MTTPSEDKTTDAPQRPQRVDRMARLETIPRLNEEKRTLEAMVASFCHAHHGTKKGELCDNCRDFLAYALKRLACCPYGADKPACARCKIHCYRPAEKARARDIMRWAGPRLIFSHPVLTIKHMWYQFTKEAPEKPRNRSQK